MDLIPEDLQRLYGDRFYIVPGGNLSNQDQSSAQQTGSEEAKPSEPSTGIATTTPESSASSPVKSSEASAPTGKLVWRPKPSSKVLFIIHQSELRQKELTDLLKKIVESIKIPFDAAGFGVITGEINPADFQDMPNPFGVVFDSTLRYGDANPEDVNGGKLYFTHRLEDLTNNKDLKKELWGQLQEIQAQL